MRPTWERPSGILILQTLCAESSPAIVTPLNRLIGYEAAAKVAKQAVAEGKTIRETVIEHGFVARGDLTEDPSERSDRAHGRGSTAKGVPAFDEAEGAERKKQYDNGAGIVSSID